MDDSPQESGRDGGLPRVAVVMPVRDMDPVLVCRAVASVHGQTYPGPIELVLWDDGSATYDYRFADQWMDGRESAGERTVHPHRWEFSRGIAAARNAGADATSARWLLWLDGDDELPGRGGRASGGRHHGPRRRRVRDRAVRRRAPARRGRQGVRDAASALEPAVPGDLADRLRDQ
ncbi:glycosyltransferase [Pseudonocardia sp. T1-2H]|uniref:glycosyltransferase n=1 Tax=Pseudonocardia sp. T1-2H TaxID=3128899 RepID=UPI0031018C63